jgi:hypothetical protein
MNFDGPEVGRLPGLNPSILLQVGMRLPPVHAVKPKLAPAKPMKFLTFPLREFPTE